MEKIADLLFEARMLKMISRSGYSFLGAGDETVAEHSFITAFIAYVMTKIIPDIDALKLISMCLVHDLPEARIGDLNTVQKKYITADEDKALMDTLQGIQFGESLSDLIKEFNEGKTMEAKLAHDADQLAFVIDLKALKDTGHTSPGEWLPPVLNRLTTETGKKIADSILKTGCDRWWR